MIGLALASLLTTATLQPPSREPEPAPVALAAMNIFEADDRQPARALPQDFVHDLPIGVIRAWKRAPAGAGDQEEDGGLSTGFIVSPCHMLASYHGVFGTDIGAAESGDTYDIEFEVAGQVTTAELVDYGRYRGRPGSGDWALLRMASCLGDALGWVNVSDVGYRWIAKNDPTLVLVSTDVERDSSRLIADPRCRIRGVSEDNSLTHDCASRPGQSGAPMIAFDNGIPYVVAVNGGPREQQPTGIHFDHRVANFSTSMFEILGQVHAILCRDFGTRDPVLPGSRNYCTAA